MDKQYEEYCLVDPLFYDSPTNIAAEKKEDLSFEVSRRPVPDGWKRFIRDYWWIYHPDNPQLPPQGWKIHVSACLDNAERVLATVWDYCVRRQVSFKFLPGRHILITQNGKYAPRGSSGKLVTIYPVDEAELELILKELGEMLDGEPGPYILSDLRWGAGPLYVRYGGFAERHCVGERGELVTAIEDPGGQLVPDRRQPVFTPPDWVTLPDFLEPHLTARNTATTTELPYRIERALHFSNGGGVYVARDTRTGEQVVLKEARPHAGLAGDGADAVSRLRRERDTMERLAGLGVAPNVRDYLTLGDHHFLVQDFIEGRPLNTFFAERHPLLAPEPDQKKIAGYTEWALRIYREIERAVEAVHSRGVVINDLHMFNIMVRPDDTVTLIDFEVAAQVSEQRRQTLANPGFVAPRDRTGFAIDRYALACLRLALFMPMTSLFALDRGKAEHLAEVIAEHFGVPREFLDEAIREITRGSGEPPAEQRGSQRGGEARPDGVLNGLPRLTPDRAGWERARASMTRAILASATPGREDRLFPGDIRQFAPGGGVGFAHGAAGVLYALSVTGAGRYPEYEQWLVGRTTRSYEGGSLGFYDGLHGAAYTLAHLGYQEEALDVVGICLDEKWEGLGLDLEGGLAGIGLNLAYLAHLTGETALRDAAFRAADIVAGRLGKENNVGLTSGGDHPYAGLLRGSSGPALMFVRFCEWTGDTAFLDLAAVALRQDLRRCVVADGGALQVNEGWRTMPYLDQGSVGIGLVLEDYLAHRSDEPFAEASAAIRGAALSPYYAQSALFSGRAGMILYLSRHHAPGEAGQDGQVATQVRNLAWHALSYQGNLAFPGDQLLRLSMDLATGTAGVLLALGTALHPEPMSLPFLGPLPRPTPRLLSPGDGSHPNDHGRR